ncbi:MAG TPA: G8 domain-containing protein [Tahibacter sp.]|nr:G8 domain-containing protein [Tahibacter sp.]
MLFLQGSPAVTQQVVLPGGRYRVVLKAAQRPTYVPFAINLNPQTISVRIDNTEIGTFVPPGTSFSAHSTPSIVLEGGTHTLKIVGTNPFGGDNSALVDDVQLIAENLLVDGGFETPNLTSSPYYGYAPQSGSVAWSYPGEPNTNAAGVVSSENPSWDNGIAPEGDQVLFVQGGSDSVATQTFQAAAGQYRLTLKAARRYAQNQVLRLLIDGVEIGTVSPQSNTYATYVFDGLWLTSGNRVFSIVGQNPGGGDNSAFVDDVQLLPLGARSRAWSDPKTWVGGIVPQSGDTVEIPAGASVIFDVASTSLTSLSVEGEFHCAESDTALGADWIMVHGRFVCGSRFSPLDHRFVVTLEGGKNDGIPPPPHGDMGDKVFGAMPGAIVELHGARRATWTSLAASVIAGNTALTLRDPVDWQVGDQVVLAPTREIIDEAEVATITGVGPSANQITVTPLAKAHYGATTTYSNATTTWTLDEAAEIGLLTRKIKFQGELLSGPENEGYGGHMMTMAGSTIHASGIELYRMGQRGLLGRYPFHWHLVGDAPGQYITDSSVHESYNRCVTVHGTNQVTVADNVCYNFIGHGYFLEDGYEQFNLFDHNLGILAKKPAPAFAVPMPTADNEPADTDYRQGVDNASTGPAVFWISNPKNYYTDNAAAGSEGTGYWYHLFNSVVGDSAGLPGASAIAPRTAEFGQFDNNRVRSSRQGFSSCRFAGGPTGMDSPNVSITRLSVTHAQQGIWPCSENTRKENAVFERAIVANSPNGMQAPSPMRFKDSLFVGYSQNPRPNPAPYLGVRSIAVSLYDQGFIFDNVHFVNYERPGHSVFYPVGGAHKLTSNRIERASFQNAPNVFVRYLPSYLNTVPALWGETVHVFDLDLFGIAGTVVPPHPLMADATCAVQLTPTFPGYLCPYRYVQFRLDTEESPPIAPSVTVLRSDGVHDSGTHIPSRYINAPIVDGPYSYAYRYDRGIPSKYFTAGIEAAFPGDSPIIRILDVPTTATVSGGGTQATSIADLKALPGRGWYRHDASASLFLKPLAAGAQWYAYDSMGVCVNGAGDCAPGSRSVSPPTVTVTSPADGVRVPPSSLVTFSTTIVPVTGVQSVSLFVGDEPEARSKSTTAPFNVSTTFAQQGVHAVKLVVRYGTDLTYTAVRQIKVGEPEERIVITGAANNGTYAANAIPNLNLNMVAWTPSVGGKHVHWFDNGVYEGEITDSVTPISLTGLTQGRHEIRVAQADASDIARAVEETVVVHVVQNGVLADFEDGVDSRATYTPHNPAQSSEIKFDPGPEGYGRQNGADDLNYFDVVSYPGDGVASTATYRMNFMPGQNWSGYGKIEIMHWGPAFDLYAIYVSAGAQLIGSYTATSAPFAAQTAFTQIPGDTIVALELRHAEPGPTTPVRQHLFHIKLVP